MATILDVARMAGVSRSTVSRVINNHPGISEDKRERVNAAIQKLSYRPNLLARSLVKQATGNILVVAKTTLSDPYYSILAEALMDCASERGYNPLFYINQQDEEVPLRFLDSLYGKVDGMVFLAAFRLLDRESILYLKRLSAPMVLVNSAFGVPGVAEVNVDNYAGSYLATEKLIGLGHKRIGYAAAMVDNNFEMKLRFEAYCQAMKDHGLPVDEDLIVHTDIPSYISGYEIAPKVLANRPTALLCTNDLLALGIYRRAIERGISIPGNLSLIGFDDILSQSNPERLFVERQLNTMHQPLAQMAAYAVETLDRIIKNGEVYGNKVFPVTWVERGTVAGPAPELR